MSGREQHKEPYKNLSRSRTRKHPTPTRPSQRLPLLVAIALVFYAVARRPMWTNEEHATGLVPDDNPPIVNTSYADPMYRHVMSIAGQLGLPGLSFSADKALLPMGYCRRHGTQLSRMTGNQNANLQMHAAAKATLLCSPSHLHPTSLFVLSHNFQH